MTYPDALKRTLATFIQAALAVLIAAPVLDLNVAKSAGLAGLVAALTFAHRTVQAWLVSQAET